jgi:Tol biopolymer transport system component
MRLLAESNPVPDLEAVDVNRSLLEAHLTQIDARIRGTEHSAAMRAPNRHRLLVAGVAAAVVVIGGLAIMLARDGAPFASREGAFDGTIAYVQATYSWDGSREGGFDDPAVTVEDRRIVSLTGADEVPTRLAEIPASQRVVGGGPVGPDVKWSPDGSRIAFRLYNDSAGIYVMNRDGSGFRRLTDLPEPGELYYPLLGRFAWSPDGSQIAFISPPGTFYFGDPQERRDPSLYLVDVRDGRITMLTDDITPGSILPPISFSPDGSSIAFARSTGIRGGTHGIDVIAADGTEERRLVEMAGGDLYGFRWSPDGSRIAFSRGTDDESDEIGGGIWVINGDGSGLERIATGPWTGNTEVQAVHDAPFAWSRDGSLIASKVNAAGFLLVPTDGSEEQWITFEDNWITNFSWSPDGSQLVFSDDGGVGALDPPTWDPPSIYVIDVDGTGLQWVADGEYPDWSR